MRLLKTTLFSVVVARFAYGEIYNVNQTFSVSNGNPNGVWAYGWMPTDFSAFNLFNTGLVDGNGSPVWRQDPAGVPATWKNLGAPAYGVPSGWLMLHPGSGNEPSAIRWTAPKTGYCAIVGQFLAGDSGTMQIGIRSGSNWLWQGVNAGSFSLSPTVTAGDTIDFVVYGGYAYGSTPFEVLIDDDAEPGALINLATGKTAAADAVYSTDVAAQAVDGNPGSVWNAGSHGTVVSPHWITVDLGAVHPVYRIKLVGQNTGTYSGYTHIYELDSSVDGETWTNIAMGTLVDTTDYVDLIYPGGLGIRHLMFKVVGGTHWASLNEIEVYEPVILRKLTVSHGVARLVIDNCLPDATNIVERSMNPADPESWQPVTNLVSISPAIGWSDPVAAASTAIFYRITSPPGPYP